jgi:hypothetical protein
MGRKLIFSVLGGSLAFLMGALELLGRDQVAPGLPLNSKSFPEQTCNREISPLFADEYTGFSTPAFRVIDNVADWCGVWDTFFGSLRPKPPCNTELVDFSREVALLAATGRHSSGGFPVQITCIRSGGGSANIQVVVTESYPAPGCPVTGALTQPAAVVKVSRPVQKAIFKFESVAVDCSP